MQGCKLNIEALEQRDALSATASLSAAGVLSIQADPKGSYLVLSTPKAGTTELFDAGAQKTTDFAGVNSIVFVGSKAGDTLYNNTAVPLNAQANNNPNNTTVFNGGTSGQDVLDGSGAKGNFYASLNASGTEIGGKGYSNLFALAGTHTITTGSGFNAVYSIVGKDTFNATAGSGYLLVSANAAKVTAGKSYQIVSFFQAAFAGPQTQAAVVQADQNGNNILYLNPLNPTANVTYTISQVGGTVVVAYSDSTGARQTQTFTQPLSWVSFFSVSGVSQVVVNAAINSVLYGKSGSILVGGTGDVDVLKIHSGSGVAIGRAALNDLFAGPAGTTNGATLASNGRQAILRNDVSKASTVDYLNGNRDSVIIGVPALLNGDPVGRTGQVANNTDYWQLFYDLNTPGVF